MNLKTLSLIAATALIGVSGVNAQSTGAASAGTSSNGTAETAAKPGTPTTAKLTTGAGPTTASTGRRMRKKHSRTMRHGKRHLNHRHGKHHSMKEKSGTEKATPKPSSNGQ